MTEFSSRGRPRYSSTVLPPYSYVPGFNHHPVSHPLGHMQGHAIQAASPLASDSWQTSDEYRHGVDLFNHGFYWEAHEAWESLWHAAGRRGPMAVWLKALIKLAAAAVKLREGNERGALRHAHRSRELIAELRHSDDFQAAPRALAAEPMQEPHYCGMSLTDVESIAADIASEADHGPIPAQPNRLLDKWLMLTAEC
jgi:uncharacterized protein